VAAGALFSSLSADIDASPRFESERVADRLGRLAPDAAEVGRRSRAAPLPAAVTRTWAVRRGRRVASLVSDDGRATAIGVELDPALEGEGFDTAVDKVTTALRAIDAPRGPVGGELLLDEESPTWPSATPSGPEMLSLPIALVVMAVVFGGVLAAACRSASPSAGSAPRPWAGRPCPSSPTCRSTP
jgi:RND superfamily putative drug exporter